MDLGYCGEGSENHVQDGICHRLFGFWCCLWASRRCTGIEGCWREIPLGKAQGDVGGSELKAI